MTCATVWLRQVCPTAPGNNDERLNEWLHGRPDSGPGPVYVLKSSQDFADWWPKFEALQTALREAALQLWVDSGNVLRDPSSRAYVKRFFVSVTEEEFSRGLLWVGEEDQKFKTLVFRRTIAGLESHATDPKAKNFIDVKDGAVDAEAQKLLHEQLDMAPEHVQTIAYDPIDWAPGQGVDPEIPAHAAYLRKFLDDFCQAMVDSLRAGAEQVAITPDPVVEETTQHLRFALVRADKFKSTASTRKVEEAARQYLDASAADGEQGKALVVYGRSGAGKTYLLSQIMQESLKALDAGSVVVVRFLGTTPSSSNVQQLLTSVCQQLRRAYGQDGADDAVPSEFKELKAYFQQAVTEWPTPARPLTLFIDSVCVCVCVCLCVCVCVCPAFPCLARGVPVPSYVLPILGCQAQLTRSPTHANTAGGPARRLQRGAPARLAAADGAAGARAARGVNAAGLRRTVPVPLHPQGQAGRQRRQPHGGGGDHLGAGNGAHAPAAAQGPHADRRTAAARPGGLRQAH